MDIRQLEVFSKVFELRSFSRAAERLGISQPTVSAHIQCLEDTLGRRLFDRVGRKVIPTEEAKILYRYAIDILRKREEALSEILSLDKKVSGTVRIAASNIPGNFLIPKALPYFKNLLPDATVQVEIMDSKKVVKALSENVPPFDVGFVGTRVRNEKFESKQIGEDRIVLIAPSSFKKDKVTLEELLTLPFLLREEGSGTRATVEEALNALGGEVNLLKVVGVLGSNTALKEAVKRGAGFSFVSELSVADDVECGRLKTVEVEGLSIARNFYAIRRKDLTLPPPARIFWENLEKVFLL